MKEVAKFLPLQTGSHSNAPEVLARATQKPLSFVWLDDDAEQSNGFALRLAKITNGFAVKIKKKARKMKLKLKKNRAKFSPKSPAQQYFDGERSS